MAKILLVEDDNNLREIYEARLQAEGYTIVAANDGEQALVVAKNERPDLVISDVMMPKISGFEMLDILRNTDGLKDVKVIMLTALGQSEDKTRADQLGANKYLVKSQVTLEDIVKTAHQLLDDEEPAAAELAPVAPVVAAVAPAVVPAAVAPEPEPVTPVAPAAPISVPVAAPITAAPEPAVVPEPSAMQAAVAAPAPVTLPDPIAVDPRTDADPANDPLTMAEETAAMQAQITSFEAAPAPVPAAVVPEPVASPPSVVTEPVAPQPSPVISETPEIIIPSTPPAAVNVPTANDNTMADAVDSLSLPTPDSSQKPSEVTAVEVAPETAGAPTTPAPDQTQAPVAASPAATPPQDDGLNMHKKVVIRPITESADKKDINQLLAEEMAKSNPGGTVNDPAPNPPQGMTPPSDDASADDPNSVAL